MVLYLHENIVCSQNKNKLLLPFKISVIRYLNRYRIRSKKKKKRGNGPNWEYKRIKVRKLGTLEGKATGEFSENWAITDEEFIDLWKSY